MHLIETITLTGDASSIEFSSIPAGYADLRVVGTFRVDTAAVSSDELLIRVGNGSADSGANYDYFRDRYMSSANEDGAAAATAGKLGQIPAATVSANTFSGVSVWLHAYEGATEKNMQGNVGYADDALWYQSDSFVHWSSTAVIDTIRFLVAGGDNFVSGCTVSLYGMVEVAGGGGGGKGKGGGKPPGTPGQPGGPGGQGPPGFPPGQGGNGPPGQDNVLFGRYSGLRRKPYGE